MHLIEGQCHNVRMPNVICTDRLERIQDEATKADAAEQIDLLFTRSSWTSTHVIAVLAWGCIMAFVLKRFWALHKD